MRRLVLWTLILGMLLYASSGSAVLPQQLRSARLTDATPARNIDNEIGNVEKALADILGLPLDTDITAAPFSITAAGIVTIAQNSLAAAGATLTINDNLTVANNLVVSGVGPHAIGGMTATLMQVNIAGDFTASGGVGRSLGINTSLTPGNSNSATQVYIAGIIVEGGAGTHADFTGLLIDPPVITAGLAALTNASTLKITGAPTGATNNRALWVAAGLADFGDTVRISRSAPTLEFGAFGGNQMHQAFDVAGDVLSWVDTGVSERMRLTASGILALGTTVTTGAAAGDLVLANGGEALRFVNFAGTGTLAALSANASDQIVLGPSAHVVPAGTADTVALLAAAQTLTNKTLSAPVISDAGWSTNVAAAAQASPAVNAVRLYLREDIDQGQGTATADCGLVARKSDGAEVLIDVLVTDGGCP